MADEGRAGALRRGPTISEVASRAGVDRAVVSRILNDDPRLRIKPSTRERVLAVVAELGYQPNAAARSLRTARTRTIALLVPDFENPAYGQIIKGAETAATKAESALLTASMELGEESFEHYAKQLGNGRVDGLLLAGGGISGTREEHLDRLGPPWLCVNRTGPGKRRYVVLDDERATEVAVAHLLELGHTDVAFLSGPSDSDTAERRRLGYIAAMNNAGLDSGFVAHGDYTAAGGAAGMQQILSAKRRHTAVLVANVASAVGALYAAREAGVEVPRDLSVISIHDLSIAAFIDPPLTTVRMSLTGLGARAVELLLTRPRNEEIREVLQQPIDLIVRKSTAPPGR
ncbi:LacI family DNA-binding transcriptional regulator [Kribbella sp. NPDC000426]|uniref:LacI family DNA-binding transcriptional regulator n=1 Tax=Kribbella sp. NPDC000426 TaxID=3154255 RepID=UPI0033193DAA